MGLFVCHYCANPHLHQGGDDSRHISCHLFEWSTIWVWISGESCGWSYSFGRALHFSRQIHFVFVWAPWLFLLQTTSTMMVELCPFLLVFLRATPQRVFQWRDMNLVWNQIYLLVRKKIYVPTLSDSHWHLLSTCLTAMVSLLRAHGRSLAHRTHASVFRSPPLLLWIWTWLMIWASVGPLQQMLRVNILLWMVLGSRPSPAAHWILLWANLQSLAVPNRAEGINKHKLQDRVPTSDSVRPVRVGSSTHFAYWHPRLGNSLVSSMSKH